MATQLVSLSRGALAAVTLAACLASPSTTLAADDPRAADATDVFRDLCVSLFTGKEARADPARFKVDKLDEATVRQIKPQLVARPLWNVQAKASGAMMLVHYEPQGLCVVEVAEADAGAMKRSFAALAEATAGGAGAVATAQPDQTRKVEKTTATISMWRFPTPKADVMLAITSAAEPSFMVQHVMTASYVR